MRAAVLGHHAAARAAGRPGHLLHRLRGLLDERGGLGAPGLLGHRGVGPQLGQAARRAQPHLQRVHRVGPGIAASREVVTGGLLAEVQDEMARGPVAGPARILIHRYPFFRDPDLSD